MASWTSPEVGLAFVTAIAWLLVPGVLVSAAVGLRGFVAWTVAPTVSTVSLATGAVLAGAVGLRWSPWSAAGLATALVALIVLVRLGLRRGLGRTMPVDPRPVQWAAWGGLVPALAVGSVIVARGLRTPNAVSQTYDAVFHYNALRWILDSGSASTRTLGSLGSHGAHGFYPAAWHDIASLVAFTGVPIPVAANMTAGAVAVAGWSLACVFLVRQVCGPSVRALAVTGIVSVGFGAFPWALLDFGVLWPNQLGLVLVPVGLGAGLSLLGLAVDDALTPGPAWALGVAAVVGTGLADPSATFSLAALLLFPCCVRLWRWVRGQHRAGRTGHGVFGAAAVFVLAGATWSTVNAIPIVANVKQFDWAAYATTAGAVGEVLLNATNGRGSLWLLSAAVVVGAVVAFRRRQTAWLPWTHVLIAALFIMCAAIQTPTTHTLTGFWFNDSHRLAATLPITATPLGVVGLTWLGSVLHDRVRHWAPPSPAWGTRTVSVAACTALVAGTLFADTALRSQRKAAHDIRKSYPALTDGSTTLIDARQLAFFDRIRKSIPPDAVVANNPWNGSALLWALDGARVLFPQFNEGTWTEDQKYLALHLDQAASDPAVCRSAQADGVRFLLIGDFRFWVGDKHIDHYPGLSDPAGRPGFALVDRQGPWRLYRLTACTPGVQASGS